MSSSTNLKRINAGPVLRHRPGGLSSLGTSTWDRYGHRHGHRYGLPERSVCCPVLRTVAVSAGLDLFYRPMGWLSRPVSHQCSVCRSEHTRRQGYHVENGGFDAGPNTAGSKVSAHPVKRDVSEKPGTIFLAYSFALTTALLRSLPLTSGCFRALEDELPREEGRPLIRSRPIASSGHRCAVSLDMPRQVALPPTLAPRLIGREASAAYACVSPNIFDRFVSTGLMPKPRVFPGTKRLAWDVRELDAAIDALPHDGEELATGVDADVGWEK